MTVINLYKYLQFLSMAPVCSVFFHNYYGGHEDWLNFFSAKIAVPSILYYNQVAESIYNQQTGIHGHDNYPSIDSNSNLQQIIVRNSPNQGKDIGGKLVLIDTYQKLGFETEYGLFLHDKKSPHKANDITWANKLLEIAEPSFSQKALQAFTDKPDIGIVTNMGNVQDEYGQDINTFKSNNKALLEKLQLQFTIYPSSYKFVAGTMFWFRMKPLIDFFKKYPPLQIRAMLEEGNVLDEDEGSYTHCWERLLCWIINMQGYKMKIL